MPKKRATIWKIYEWEYISKLLDKGYPIIDSLKILQKETKEIEKQLEQGVNISSIVLLHADQGLQQHLRFFLSITSLSHSITCAIHMIKFENLIKKKLKKELTYPIFIFFFAYLTLFLFIQFVIPQLLLSFPSDEMDIFFILSITLLKLLCYCITIMLVAIAIIGILYKKKGIPKNMVYKAFHLALCKEYNSYIFSSYLKELEQDGLSTKKAVHYLTTIPDKQVFSCFINDVQKRMERGEELSAIISHHPFLNPVFQTNFIIGVTTGTLVECLEDYIAFQEEQWSIKIRRFSTGVQLISYGFVGFLVVMVYQILLVPLQLLDTM